MPTSTDVTNLKINQLTEAQYNAAVQGGIIGANELSIITDIDTKPVQVNSLPTAAADELGNIYQFVGATDANYTNGYFYKCVSDGATPTPNYSWSQTDVQPAADPLPSQSGQNGKYLTTNGTSVSWATIDALQNTATRYDSLTINGNATSTQRSINIGYGSTAQAPNTTSSYKGAISIGYNCYANCNGIVIGESASNSSMFEGVVIGHGASAGGSGYYATVIGSRAAVTANSGIAIGPGAVSAADGAIQIAWGGNSGNTEAYTLKIGLNGVNYKLLDSDGTIPEARLADTTNAQQGDVLTLDANGNAVWQAGGAPTVPSTMPTLAVNDWASNTQTVNVTGVTASNVVFVSPAPASAADYASAGITCTAQGSGTLTFTCATVPSNAITVNIVIFG